MAGRFIMEIMRFELTAFRMRTERSPTELYPRTSDIIPHFHLNCKCFLKKISPIIYGEILSVEVGVELSFYELLALQGS